jgi:hypothetical protein
MTSRATLDLIVEKTCRDMRDGGDHESRRHVAERLIEAERASAKSLKVLRHVARNALAEFLALQYLKLRGQRQGSPPYEA